MTIALSPEIEARLRAEAEKIGQSVDDLAEALLSEALTSSLPISPEELAQNDAGIARAEADFAAGRFRTLEEVIADKKARFGLSA
jgi:predicted transcriptional regulator